MLHTHHTLPIGYASLVSTSLDPWQPSLKYSNSATELLSDSVAQLVKAWQAICQVVGSSPSPESLSLSFPLFLSLISFFLTDFYLG